MTDDILARACHGWVPMADVLEEVRRLRAENERLTVGLRSIAANTCCGRCQEAALVARAALAATKPET